MGNFEEFYKESIKHKNLLGWSYSFEKKSVYLWLLLLYETDEKTKSYSKLLSDVFTDIEYNNTENIFLEDNINEIWKTWKTNFKLDKELKSKVIKWLGDVVENRVDAIMQGNFRKSYYKAALLVVSYSEILASENIKNKTEGIEYYIKKYSRRSAFRAELADLM